MRKNTDDAVSIQEQNVAPLFSSFRAGTFGTIVCSVTETRKLLKIAKTALTKAPEVFKLILSNFHTFTPDYLK